MQVEYATERLELRRFTSGDAPFVLQLHSNPDLVRFIPTAAMESHDDAMAWIERVSTINATARGWWCVSLKDGPAVGTVVVKPIPASRGHTQDDTEIGWRMHAAFTGRGYATEAARAVLDAALGGGLDRVVAVVNPLNLASQRVCLRLGMRHLGLTDRYYDQTVELFEAP